MENQTNQPMKQFEPNYKIGSILILISAVLGVFIKFILICVGIVAISNSVATSNAISQVPTGQSEILYAGLAGTLILLILSSIFVIPSIINLVLSIKTLKERTYKYKIALAILGIIFGGLLGIIGGILMLVTKTDNSNM